MDWISVEDRLPETVRQFQIFIVATDKGIGVANFDRLNGFDRVTITGNVQHSHHIVTHWMPLPEKPNN